MTENFFNFSLFEKTEFHNIESIILDARKCINLLSQKLGNKKWLFGDTYSESDVTIYSYLSLLYNIPLKENPIKAHIHECPNLLNYINQISKQYFPING